MKLQNVVKNFSDKKILDGFSYSFPKKGVFFIDGESGIGKTTLLNIIAGLEKVDSGSVELNRVAYLFQEDRLLEWVSVLENVICVTKKTQEDNKRCVDLLTRLGLEKEIHNMPSSLSGGMRRRVAIARTLMFNADTVLLDEPFKGLDQKTLENTIDVIKEFTKEKLVIIVSHENDKKYFDNHSVITLGKS